MILITEFMDDAAVERLKETHPTTYRPDLADRPDDIAALLPGTGALIVRNRTQVNKELLASAPDLRVVGRLGVGLDNIDLEECMARRIDVIPATGANTLAVAEYVITSVLILLRNAYFCGAQMLAGDWPRSQCAGREVSGRQLGLIGFGAAAQASARLAHRVGMWVVAYDPYLDSQHPAWRDIRPMPFSELLQTSDAISLHVPLTAETRHLINADNLASMSKNAVLINAARGGIVDEAALVQALRAGKLAGAALDVFENEPLDAEAARQFAAIPNLMLTPHIAGVTQDSNTRVSSMIADLVTQRLHGLLA